MGSLGHVTPGKETWYPLYEWLGELQDRFGRVRKFLPPPRFDPQAVQLIAKKLLCASVSLIRPCSLILPFIFIFTFACFIALLSFSLLSFFFPFPSYSPLQLFALSRSVNCARFCSFPICLLYKFIKHLYLLTPEYEIKPLALLLLYVLLTSYKRWVARTKLKTILTRNFTAHVERCVADG